MVGPRLLLTNNHVLTDAGQAADSVVEFEYFVRADGSPSTIRVFQLQPEIFFKTDPDLDFSLVAVAEVGENGTVLAAQGWNQLINRHLGDSAAGIAVPGSFDGSASRCPGPTAASRDPSTGSAAAERAAHAQ